MALHLYIREWGGDRRTIGQGVIIVSAMWACALRCSTFSGGVQSAASPYPLHEQGMAAVLAR